MRGGCSWWHFFPGETSPQLHRVYNQILQGKINYRNTDLGVGDRLGVALKYLLNIH